MSSSNPAQRSDLWRVKHGLPNPHTELRSIIIEQGIINPWILSNADHTLRLNQEPVACFADGVVRIRV